MNQGRGYARLAQKGRKKKLEGKSDYEEKSRERSLPKRDKNDAERWTQFLFLMQITAEEWREPLSPRLMIEKVYLRI